jgi:PAS domain S-box-containing protein
VWDSSFRITRFNHAFDRLTGLKDDEVIGKQLDILFPEISRDESMRLIENALSGERWETVEIPILHVNGTVRTVLWNSANIHDRDKSKVVATIAQGQDITKRKRAEEALEMANDELARQVVERTRELAEKEVLLKEVHHRVKNNMQVISSLVSLQADGSGDETVREVLKDVTYRVRSMALVHEKLYQSADLARIDFAEYARSLLGYLWRAHGAAAANVRLTLDLEQVLLPVDTGVPCGLILNELVGNALKHAFQGRSEGEVTVALQNSVDGRIRLSVSDNGVGLPPGFDWRQASSLGLHLVKLLSKQLGASVEVSGEGGTRFEMIISSRS